MKLFRKKENPTDLTWEEENPTFYQSLLFKDICGESFKNLVDTIKKRYGVQNNTCDTNQIP